MKGYDKWSYAPYRPFLYNVGNPYVCRIVPSERAIRFEWLKGTLTDFEVFYRKRGDGKFIKAGDTNEDYFVITNLEPETDYEFFVRSGDEKSRIRLARTGANEGIAVNYLHPDDDAYSFSGKYLCSPSMVRHPDGYLLASMDLYAHNYPQNLTLIFRSDDDGKSWKYVSELMPCFWGKMFIHKGDLYMLSVSTEYGDLLIGKSTDGGKTFSTPVCILRGANGKNGSSGVHKNPQNIFIHNGRIYTTMSGGNINLFGDGQPADMPRWSGLSPEEVTDYIVTNHLLLLEKLKKTDRNTREIVTTPGMPQFRTTAHIKSDHSLKVSDIYRHFDDSVCAINDFDHRDHLLEVPLRALTRRDYPNIITAGRSADGTGYGWDILRVIPPAILTGQAAGEAAALAVETNTAITDVDIKTLQRRLEAQNVMIHFPDELVPEDKTIVIHGKNQAEIVGGHL